ncbi:MAG: hypothetical protein HYU28_12680, partial [Actinobacteria bacterium]|nr:hypothetical protein [Actinomycetota bacterium]
ADLDALNGAMVRHGWLKPDHGLDMTRVAEVASLMNRSLIGPDPFTFTREHARRVVESTMSIQGPYGDIIKHVTLPPDHIMLNRIQLGVMALLGRLEATGNWSSIFDEYILGAAPVTPLGEMASGWPRPRASVLGAELAP